MSEPGEKQMSDERAGWMEAEAERRNEGDSGAENRPDVRALGFKLREEYEAARNARQMVELRWLEDLRQYRGVYSPEVSARLAKTKRSRVFYRLTTAKINTMAARLMDLLFPQKLKNWSIEPTPDPDLPEEIIMTELEKEIRVLADSEIQAKVMELARNNIGMDREAERALVETAYQAAYQTLNTKEARVRIAKERAAAMEKVIDDQLKESGGRGRRRESWQQCCRSIVKSACLYGMGILKGPLVEKAVIRKYMPERDESGGLVWRERASGTELKPFFEAVSIWDIFPDPGARTGEDLRYVWQLHLMTDKDLLDLADFPGFRRDIINKYIKEHGDGDATLTSWENQVRDLNDDNMGGTFLQNRYRIYERWGFLSGRDLALSGLDIAEERQGEVFSSNVWMLGDEVIKAAINPLEGVSLPYFFYPYQQDETSFWPEGIASAMRAPQAGINAAVRAMQDNAAASSGPIFGINTAYLDGNEDPTEMRANRIFLFDKPGMTLQQMFQAVAVPSCVEHNLSLSSFWQNAADEVSTPKFNSGDGNVAGAGQTATGLSMLMGASNILLKDHIKDFDDFIISPFISALFKWNMKWNPREDIKGDFEIVASGSQSLVAREVRAQQLPVMISYMGMPQFEPYIRPDKLFEVALEQTDLPSERIMRTEEEAERHIEEQRLANAKANVEALTEELAKRGMPPEEIQRQLLIMAAAMSGEAGERTNGESQSLP